MNCEAVAVRRLVILGIVSLIFLAGCGGGSYSSGGGSHSNQSGTNPTPTITTISPTSAVAGGAAFTLTVNGAYFVANSVVRWNGTDRPTAFVSSNQVTAQIPASDIAATGT